ncbi:sensor histidine kinase [Facklamia sp. P9177]|uniref:sensor histidine kinase n=1 Tax=Facklamia sp. P9177 TaxID=3421945 RepID=UPI003D17AA17
MINKNEEKKAGLIPSFKSFKLSKSDRIEMTINLFIVAGTVSFIYLVLMFSYQQLLNFLTFNLGWTIKTNLKDNIIAYTLYNKSNQILIGLYLATLFITVTFRYIHERNRITLRYIRKYISAMAKGKYDLRIPNEGIGDYVTLAQDVNTLMDSINQAFKERDETEKTKDELMNNIGHDIRTPLTSILGYLRLIQDSSDLTQEELASYIKTVHSKAKSMQVLINDLFEYTSTQQTTAKVNKQAIAMQAFTEQVLADFNLQAKQAGIEMFCQVTPSDLVLEIDPEKMVRVFNNFITNTFKYGEGATYQKILVTEMTDQEYKKYTRYQKNRLDTIKTEKWVVIEFRNNGTLLNEEDLERVFERSYRADSSRTSQKPGSGLGLAIVRNMVALHQGVAYGIVEDQDLVFRVEIPILREDLH